MVCAIDILRCLWFVHRAGVCLLILNTVSCESNTVWLPIKHVLLLTFMFLEHAILVARSRCLMYINVLFYNPIHPFPRDAFLYVSSSSWRSMSLIIILYYNIISSAIKM